MNCGGVTRRPYIFTEHVFDVGTGPCVAAAQTSPGTTPADTPQHTLTGAEAGTLSASVKVPVAAASRSSMPAASLSAHAGLDGLFPVGEEGSVKKPGGLPPDEPTRKFGITRPGSKHRGLNEMVAASDIKVSEAGPYTRSPFSSTRAPPRYSVERYT